MTARVDDKVCPVTLRDQLVCTLESTGCEFFLVCCCCCCLCCAVCSEIMLKMLQYFDLKSNSALNHQLFCLQEHKNVQATCCRHGKRETSVCLLQLQLCVGVVLLNSRSKRCRLLKPLLLSICWEFRAGLCLTLLRLISRLKPLIVFLYHLDNYRCSKITAQQTVKLYLWQGAE